ncbi:hypothetical protein C3L33_02615, partial [Rhododendron williamsianum]
MWIKNLLWRVNGQMEEGIRVIGRVDFEYPVEWSPARIPVFRWGLNLTPSPGVLNLTPSPCLLGVAEKPDLAASDGPQKLVGAADESKID